MKTVRVWVTMDYEYRLWNERKGLIFDGDGTWTGMDHSSDDHMKLRVSLGMKPGEIREFRLVPVAKKKGRKRAKA